MPGRTVFAAAAAALLLALALPTDAAALRIDASPAAPESSGTLAGHSAGSGALQADTPTAAQVAAAKAALPQCVERCAKMRGMEAVCAAGCSYAFYRGFVEGDGLVAGTAKCVADCPTIFEWMGEAGPSGKATVCEGGCSQLESILNAGSSPSAATPSSTAPPTA